MRIVLASVESGLTAAWHRFCQPLDNVEVFEGSILEAGCDAVVSPANSFGFMDGGIDGIYLDYFGRAIQHRVQSVIDGVHHGELLVGQADIVPTDHPDVPWLICAPTMRVPMILSETVNPYLAARAIFLLVAHGVFLHGPHAGEPVAAHIQSIALPGLGTGVGRVPANVCAHQVRTAYDDVWGPNRPFPDSWAEASERHQLLYTDRLRRLQVPGG
jgi:O-acetyl-ADP-ribose deacetylase (regulator of RNase III)